MTVTEARGFGREKSHGDHTDSRVELTDYTPAVRVEAVVPNSAADNVMQTILEAAHTGGRGDGKIFVLPVEDAVRIKTGERGEAAI